MVLKKAVQMFAIGLIASVAAATAAQAQHGHNAQAREGFWVSGGLGYGSLGCDNCGSRENGVSGGLSLGTTLSPRLLVGVGTDAWTKTDQGARLTVGTLDARVRFYPSASGGLFLTGGVGGGSVRASAGNLTATETGLGMMFGLGYDYRIARNTSITPYWSGFAMKNSNTNANVGQLGLAVTLH